MAVAEGRGAGVSPIWPSLLVCAGLALAIDYGTYHREHYADSLVPVLTSLYRWTPFFWGCNRIGMLVPLLAMPFQHPLTNLLVQCWLVLFAALAVIVLLPRYLLRDRTWPFAASAATLAFLLLLPRGTRFVFTFGQPHYVVSLALGLAALLLIERRAASVRWGRLFAALVLMLLASWVSSATPVYLGPLVLLRGWLLRREQAGAGDPEAGPSAGPAGWRPALDREGWLGLGLVLAGALGTSACLAALPCSEDPVAGGLVSPLHWPAGWLRLAHNTGTCLAEPDWPASQVPPPPHPAVSPGPVSAARKLIPRWPVWLVLLAAAAALWRLPAVRARAGVPLRAALVLVGAAVLSSMAIATLRWVQTNDFHCRYAIPGALYLQAALALLLVCPLCMGLGPRARLRLSALAVGLLVLAELSSYGRPAHHKVRSAIDGWTGLAGWQTGPFLPRTHEILAARCSHVVGRYWLVWPIVFQANLQLHEKGDSHRVWGVAGRCLSTWDRWGCLPPEDLRVAVFREGDGLDPEGKFYLEGFFPPMQTASTLSTVQVMRPQVEMALAPGAARTKEEVLLCWHSGFYGPEGEALHSPRWCRGQGKLTLVNAGQQTRAVEIAMDLRAAACGRVYVEGPGFSQAVAVGPEHGELHQTLHLPPGRTNLVFGCDAPVLQPPGEWRELSFRVAGFRLTDTTGADEACAAPNHEQEKP